MQFVSAAQIGDFVETQPEVVRRTSALVFMRGTLSAGPRIVAIANGVWKILGAEGGARSVANVTGSLPETRIDPRRANLTKSRSRALGGRAKS